MKISDAEWEVMRLLWERSPQTAAEVIDALGEVNGWNHRTIRTMLARLVDKGALDYEVDGNKYCYRPKTQESDCVRQRSDSFLAKVFGGSASALVTHFVEDADLSAEEIQSLKKLLDSKKKSR